MPKHRYIIKIEGVTVEFANNRGLPREAWIEFVPKLTLFRPEAS